MTENDALNYREVIKMVRTTKSSENKMQKTQLQRKHKRVHKHKKDNEREKTTMPRALVLLLIYMFFLI